MKENFREFARFEKNGKWYFIGFGKNKEFRCYVKKDGKAQESLSGEDKQVFVKVLDGLIVNIEKSIDLGIKKIDGKLFNIFFDERTGFYYWYKVINGIKTESTEEENCKLNFIYNHIPSVVYAQKFEDEDDGEIGNPFAEFNEIINAQSKEESGGKSEEESGGESEEESGGESEEEFEWNFEGKSSSGGSFSTIIKGVTVFIACWFTVTACSYRGEVNRLMSESRDKSREQRHIVAEDYDWSKIATFIDSNANLNDSEKNLLKNLRFVFDENHQYMNLSTIINRLNSLQINYSPAGKTNKGKSITGEYNKNENIITIYNCSGFDDASKISLIHEILHVLQTYNYKTSFMMELSNENATREVVRRLVENGIIYLDSSMQDAYGRYTSYGNNYDEFMPVYYWLGECLTQEQCQDYQFYPDDEILVEALVNLDKASGSTDEEYTQKSRARKLIHNIDCLERYDRATSAEKYALPVEDVREIFEETNYYFTKAKNGKKMDECLATQILNYDVKIYIDETIEALNSSGQSNPNAIVEAIYQLSNPNPSTTSVTYTGPYLIYKSSYIPRTYLSNRYPNAMLNLLFRDYVGNAYINLNDYADSVFAEYLKKESMKESLYTEPEL